MAFSNRESVLVDELNVFAGGILLNYATYQMAQPDALTIRLAVDEFIAARAVAVNPATRTVGSIDIKLAKKASALGICRTFYRLIQSNNGVSNEDKLLIGVLPLNNTRTPRNCPASGVEVGIVATTPLAFTATFSDSVDPARRGLPPGATMCQLFVMTGEANFETFDDANARFVGNFTRNPMAVVFDAGDRGKQATLFARWGGKRNEFGSFSLPVSMTVAA